MLVHSPLLYIHKRNLPKKSVHKFVRIRRHDFNHLYKYSNTDKVVSAEVQHQK